MEEERYGNNDDVSPRKPTRKPKDRKIPGRGLGVAELERLISGQQQPLLKEPTSEDHNPFGRAPDTFATPLQSTSNMNKSFAIVESLGRLRFRRPSPGAKQPQYFPVCSFSNVYNSTHSILCKGYFLPPQQLPVLPYQKEMATNTQEHSTICPSSLMIPLPTIMKPASDEKYGAKRAPPHLIDETVENGQKRRCDFPIVDIPNWPLLLRASPNAHSIARGLQPTSTDADGRFHIPGNVAIRPLDSSPTSIPGRLSSDNQRKRLNPGGGSLKIAPPANLESLAQRLTPGGKSLTLAPLGNVESHSILKSRQPPDTGPDDSGTICFQDLRSSGALDGYTSLPFHTFYPRVPTEAFQANPLDSSQEYDPDIDIELKI